MKTRELMPSLHFLYHELRPEKTAYSYVIPTGEFTSHCELYGKLHRDPGSMYRPEITFDDGHLSDLTQAVPILHRFGLAATFFITAGWMGRKQGYMSWAQVRELQRAGHTVGAHGMTHKLLTQCSAAELDTELRGARELIEDRLGAPVGTMSLPGGRANARVQQACREAGFTQVFTSVPRPALMEQSPSSVGRLNLLGGTSQDWLDHVLDPDSGQLHKLERKDKLKSSAKQILGDRMYARLWGLVNREEAEAYSGEGTAS